jgi:hypothetical protein
MLATFRMFIVEFLFNTNDSVVKVLKLEIDKVTAFQLQETQAVQRVDHPHVAIAVPQLLFFYSS